MDDDIFPFMANKKEFVEGTHAVAMSGFALQSRPGPDVGPAADLALSHFRGRGTRGYQLLGRKGEVPRFKEGKRLVSRR